MTSRDDNVAEALAKQLMLEFRETRRNPPPRLIKKHYDESAQMLRIVTGCEWFNLPSSFFTNAASWVLLTRDGFDYCLPGVVLAALVGDEESRPDAITMLDDMCTSRSLMEWVRTLEQLSGAQMRVLKNSIGYLRDNNVEIWVNTVFDQAVRECLHE